MQIIFLLLSLFSMSAFAETQQTQSVQPIEAEGGLPAVQQKKSVFGAVVNQPSQAVKELRVLTKEIEEKLIKLNEQTENMFIEIGKCISITNDKELMAALDPEDASSSSALNEARMNEINAWNFYVARRNIFANAVKLLSRQGFEVNAYKAKIKAFTKKEGVYWDTIQARIATSARN